MINTYPGAELTRILREYGDERFAGRISKVLVVERARQPFTTSARLVELVRAAIPAATRRTGGNPAKRTFQALRIEVNDELGALRRAIPVALQHLSVAGRIVVMSYQSLEDRIVKRAIAPLTVSTSPLDLPVDLPGHDPEFALADQGRRRNSERVRDPGKPQGRVRAAAGGAAHQGGNIVTTDQLEHGDRGHRRPTRRRRPAGAATEGRPSTARPPPPRGARTSAASGASRR